MNIQHRLTPFLVATMLISVPSVAVQTSGGDRLTGDSAQIPETTLRFREVNVNGKIVEITPDIVSEYGRKRRFHQPIADEANVYAISEFVDFVHRRSAAGRAGIFIGVVVDDRERPYSTSDPDYSGRDHFRAVRARITELVEGYTDVDSQAPTPGIAEVYGAEITGIIPLRYFDGAERIDPGGARVPIRVNDIFIFVNDHVLPVELEEPDYLPDTVLEMEEWLLHLLSRDRHLYSWEEYRASQDLIIARAKSKYE